MRTRWLHHPAVVNMRDLGGLPLDGGGTTRRDLVFRSASLAGVPDDAAASLMTQVSIRTVLDLRTASELDRDGRPEALLRAGAVYRLVPVEEDLRVLRSLRRPGPRDYLGVYRATLERIGPALSALVGAVVAGEVPIVFTCTAGKDRSGVLAAIFLLALGVSRAAISADYALSARALRLHLASFRPHWERKGLTEADYACRLETRRDTMEELLATRFDSARAVEQFLDTNGVDPQELAAARERLCARP